MKYDVYGMGNALVDLEFEVTDSFLAQHDIEKGLMTLIDEPRHHHLLKELTQTFSLKKRAGGGSGGNTLVAISQFGGKTFYACKVANDEFGEFYMNDLHSAGVETRLDQVRGVTEGVTGKCMVMVTSDAERTMNTFLGITSDFSPSEVYIDELKQSEYLYIEGYLVTSDSSRQAIKNARAVARDNHIKVALTFSDPSMATYFKPGLEEIMAEGVDILFCNDDEAMAFTGAHTLEDAIADLKTRTKKLVLTQGSEGALVVNDHDVVKIKPFKAHAIDTNGAGDMFAGAFMYGITQGMNDQQAGELASRASSKMVTVFGARLPKEDHKALLNA